jgi:hypothetical protein
MSPADMTGVIGGATTAIIVDLRRRAVMSAVTTVVPGAMMKAMTGRSVATRSTD